MSIEQDILTDKEHLIRQIQASQLNLKEHRITVNYLIYLIKDLCNYFFNPDDETKHRIMDNLKVYFRKINEGLN